MSNLRDVLRDIHQQRGALTPQIVVAEARDDAHPLHHRFEWNDTVAGEKYREVQAAQLIRSVRVKYGETADGAEKTVRGFLPVRRDTGDELGVTSSYEPTEDVLADDFRRRIVLQEFDREWKQFKSRYGHLQEFADALAAEAMAVAS